MFEINKSGCENKHKKIEEKKHDAGCACHHGAEKTATNNQWGK